MNTQSYEIPVMCGSHISQVAQQAIDLAKDKGVPVKFNFNGVMVTAVGDSNADDLAKAYHCSLVLKHNTAGPYAPDDLTLARHEKRSAEIEEEIADRQREWKAKSDRDKAHYELLVSGLEFETNIGGISPLTYANATDSPLDKGAYHFANRWALVMQSLMDKGEQMSDGMTKTAHDIANYDGVTGAMSHVAKVTIARNWKYGSHFAHELVMN